MGYKVVGRVPPVVGLQRRQGFASPVPASGRFGRSSLACRAGSALDLSLQSLPWSSLASFPRFPRVLARFRLPSVTSRSRVPARAPSIFMRALGSCGGVSFRAPKRAACVRFGLGTLRLRSFLPSPFASLRPPSLRTARPRSQSTAGGRSPCFGRSSLRRLAAATLAPDTSPSGLQPARHAEGGDRGGSLHARLRLHSLRFVPRAASATLALSPARFGGENAPISQGLIHSLRPPRLLPLGVDAIARKGAVSVSTSIWTFWDWHPFGRWLKAFE